MLSRVCYFLCSVDTFGAANRRFEKGEIVRFTVGDLLKAAHKTLDDLNPQRFPMVPGKEARYRHTGGALLLTFTYKNFVNLNFWDFSKRCSITAKMQEGVWGFTGLQRSPNLEQMQSQVEMGFVLRISFVAGGRLGQFDAIALIMALVSGVVLVFSAGIATDVLGHFIFDNWDEVIKDTSEVKLQMKRGFSRGKYSPSHSNVEDKTAQPSPHNAAAPPLPLQQEPTNANSNGNMTHSKQHGESTNGTSASPPRKRSTAAVLPIHTGEVQDDLDCGLHDGDHVEDGRDGASNR